MPPEPPPQQLYIYIYKNKLSVCLSSDVRCVDRRHCKDWAVCVMKLCVDWRNVCQLMKLQTGTKMTTGTRGYREYKWRPGTSKRNYRLGHRDTGNINDDRDTVTQLQRGWRGYREDIYMTTETQGLFEEKLQTGTPGHKWRPGRWDTGNINDDRDTGTINNDRDKGTHR